MKKWTCLLICAVFFVFLAACGSEPVEPLYMAVEDIYDALKAEGLPIGDVIVYDAKTDPNGVLGRPEKYIGKGDFEDTSIEFNGYELSGGTLEVFDDKDICTARHDYLSTFSLKQYIYKSDYAILRVSYEVLPDDATMYETAFNKVTANMIGKTSDPARVSTYDLNEYKQQLAVLYADIDYNAIGLGNIYTYMINYYKSITGYINGTYDGDAALTSAYEWIAEESDYTKESMELKHGAIVEAYQSIMEPPAVALLLHEKEIAELKDIAAEIYDAYTKLHDHLDPAPAGVSDFKKIQTALENYAEAAETVESILG